MAIRARSARSGAAHTCEAPCCPYSEDLHSKAPWPGFPHFVQKWRKPSARLGHLSAHLPLLNFLQPSFFLVSQSLWPGPTCTDRLSSFLGLSLPPLPRPLPPLRRERGVRER